MNKHWYRRGCWGFIVVLVTTFMTIVWSAIVPHPALAHWADLSVAEILVQDTNVSMTLTFPTGLVNFADRDRNGQLSTNEVRQANPELESLLAERIQMKGASGQVGKLHLAPNVPDHLPAAADTTTRHSTVQLTYQWTEPIQDLTIHYDLFLPGVSTAQCLATVLKGNRTQSIIFTPTQKDITLSQGLNWRSVASFVTLGIEHILTGYDHILFLVSLLLLGGTLGNLVKIATAFTIAHSITLTLAVLNLVTVPSALIESLIALSIVYVASENLWRKEAKHRWFVVFCFGLVHGLGFARILQEMNLAGGNLAISLISFNLGVELGQLGIVTLVFLMLKWLQKFQWHRRFQRMVSWITIAIGLIWFLERAFSLQIP